MVLRKKVGGNFKKNKQMKYFFLSITFSSIFFSATAQIVSGEITYNRKQDWVKIMTQMPWMTEQQITRAMLNFGKWDKGEGINYTLLFNNNQSIYTIKEEESSGRYQGKQRKFMQHRDYKNEKVLDWIETLDKKFVIKDELPKTKWKILNEIREVKGYLCMKAETTDTIRNRTIYAWYTDAIPFNGGPEGFGGLPGLILELNMNDGECIISATNIDLKKSVEKLPIPKKIKGKEVALAEFNLTVSKYISESLEGERNPYWRIRY